VKPRYTITNLGMPSIIPGWGEEPGQGIFL